MEQMRLDQLELKKDLVPEPRNVLSREETRTIYPSAEVKRVMTSEGQRNIVRQHMLSMPPVESPQEFTIMA